MYLPKSKYKKAKSTGGTEFIIKGTTTPYKGKYIETYKGDFYGGNTPEENGPQLEKIKQQGLQLPFSLLGLLAGAFKAKPTQSDKEKGYIKRYLIQNKNTKRITETDKDTYQANQSQISNNVFASLDWTIKGPAEDKMFGNYPFEGAETKNKKTIESLEKYMPGISTFIADYKYLVEDTTATQLQQQNNQVSETHTEQDTDTQLENFRKANFDTRK